jgi:periplasmic divalent cation tolerance protein
MIIVYTTSPDIETARKLAQGLIGERLAACAHIGAPIEAIYRWQGQTETAQEIPLTIKTMRSRYPALQSWLLAHHPYEVPEIVAVDVIEASPAYCRWMQSQTEIDSGEPIPL